MEAHNSFSHSFSIDEISYTGTTFTRQVNNELDFFGSFLGTSRLPSEKNASYKKRLLDTYANRSNSSYTGLINGVTRELGLEFFSPLQITLNITDPDDYPQIDFKDSNVYIWKSVLDEEPELIINRSDSSLPEYFIQGLIDKINTSTNITASIVVGNEFKRSDCILNYSSTKLVNAQQILGSKINILGNKNIQKESIVFSTLVNFREEVSSKSLVLSRGQYYVDYINGIIHSFDIPEEGTFIQYSFREDSFLPKASPVIIRAIHSEDFKQVMFNKIQETNNTFSFGTPTEKGSSIINELLSVVPIYWGE